MLDLSLAFLSGLILGTFIGGALGLYGYGQARDQAYRDFLNAQARRLGLLNVPQDVQ